MQSVKTIIFDYSGTLSLDAVEFGRPQRLMAELEASGLAALGISSVEFFWSEIVNPTWEAGSATPVGYVNLLERRLTELFQDRIDSLSPDTLKNAVSSFAARYFESCRIDQRWKNLLQRFSQDPSLVALVATDHYREATETIIKELARLGIRGSALEEAENVASGTSFWVANSADLGVRKTDRRFWESVAWRFPDLKGGRILLVDDFGYNEASGSAYALSHRVEKRQKETISILESVFDSSVAVVPFLIHSEGDIARMKCRNGESQSSEIEELIKKVEERYRAL